MVAFEFIKNDNLRTAIFEQFTKTVQDVAGIDCFDHEVEDCRLRLRQIYLHSGYNQNNDNIIDDEINRNNNVSPVCVSGMVERCALKC